MRRLVLCLIAAACCLAALSPANAQRAATQRGADRSAFETAATVNDSPITFYDIDQRMRLLRFNGAPDSPNLRNIAIDQLIDDRLKRAAGERLGIRAQESRDAELIRSYAENARRDPGSIDRDLARVGATRATLLDALRAEAVWREVIRSRFGARTDPSDGEVEQAISLAASGRNREFRLAELVLPISQRGESGTQTFARQLATELAAGGDFAAAARRHSASASAREGGSIGWVPEGSLPPAVLGALDAAGSSGVTQPITLQGAVAILKVLETRTVEVDGAGNVSVSLLAISTQDRNQNAAIAKVEAVRAQNPTCETGERIARAAGLNAQRAPMRALSTLPGPVRQAVANVQAGDLSAPVPVQGGAVVFIVCERQEGLTSQAREQVRNRLRQERFARFSNSYLQELRADAIIERK